MSNHIIISGTTAAIIDFPAGLTGDQWGAIQGAFCERVQPGVPFLNAYDGCFRLWDERRRGPVLWDEELAGPGGMSFLLFPLPDATPADVRACVDYLTCERDVVRLCVMPITDWITDFDPAACLNV